MSIRRVIRTLSWQEADAGTSQVDEDDTLLDEDDTLLMDDQGHIRINFDNPQVQEKILDQLRTYRDIPKRTKNR